MKYLDLTFSSPQSNLACDEALLGFCEDGYGHEVLRFWEPREYFVVAGHSSKVDLEVQLSFCIREGIPVLRRCSGGSSVLQGPGCLNYTLIIKIPQSGPLTNIPATNAFIMQRHQRAMQHVIGTAVEIQGFSDLALGTLKFSGNSQYRKRSSLLFHGTFLYDFAIERVAEFLRAPGRQPAYRQGRSHKDFLMNLPVPSRAIKEALIAEWRALQEIKEFPVEPVEKLVREKYSRADWNFMF